MKKAVRILLGTIAVLFLLFTGFYFALRSSVFQTWASNRIAGYFSGKWNTVVHVQGVDIEFWKKIVIEGVYIEDQHRDTLLYAEKLKLDITKFNRDSNRVFLNDIILKNATVKLKQYSNDSVLNFQFIVDEFTSNDTILPDSAKWNIGISGITLDNIRFAYIMESNKLHPEQEKDKTSSDSIMSKTAINFSDILANSVKGKISDIKFENDTIHCTINNFSLKEKSGFQLKELYSEATVSPVRLQLFQTKIFSNHSQFISNIVFQYKKYSDFKYFIDKVKIKAQINSSNIEMSDIAYFTNELYGIKKRIFLNGNVSGKVNDLRGKNIMLVIGDETSFMGDFNITGLPDINQTFMMIDAKELRTSKKGIEEIPLPPFDKENFISLPQNISLFGIIKFKGNFSGFYNDFVSYGTFNTALGQITTDIALKEDTLNGIPGYHGKFSCRDFYLGKFLESEKYLGKITMNAIVDGKGLKKENANLSVNGTVQRFEFNNYDYQNIEVKGRFAKNVFDGQLAARDENLDFDFNGTMDFSTSPTVINFASEIKKANLSAVHFMKSDEYTGLTAKVQVNLVGNTLDDMQGKIQLNDVVYLKGKEVFDFKNLFFSVVEKSGIKTVDLTSDIADAKLQGKFKPLEVLPSLTDFLEYYIPSFQLKNDGHPAPFSKEKTIRKFHDAFVYSVMIKNPDVVTRAFFPFMQMAPSSSVSGKYNSDMNDLSLDADIPFISINKYKFNRCTMNASSVGNIFSVRASSIRLSISDSVWMDNIYVSSNSANDTMQFNLKWKNNIFTAGAHSMAHYEGDVPGYIAFSNQPKIKLKILPSNIIIADSIWKINADNEIAIDSSFISVSNLDFTCGKQLIKLKGNLSESKGDRLYLILSSFSLANFNSALKGSGFSIYGTVSGNTSIGNIFDKPVFGSSIDIHQLQLNNDFIGDGTLASVYDSKKEIITFNGRIAKSEGGAMKFSGTYFPYKKDSSIEMDAEVQNLSVNFLEPLIKDYVSNIKGTANAELKINGTPQKILITGKVKTKIDNARVKYLGTDYHFEGDIQVEPDAFDFAGIKIYDVNQNSAEIVNGKIFHNNFKKFQMDIDMNLDKFLCIHTAEKDNPVYYGKCFATGILNVFGFFDNINLSASIKSDKAKNLLGKNEYTQLFIPLAGSSEVSESGFISFVKNDTSVKVKPTKYKVNTTGFTMNLKLEATPDAQVQIIFDEKVGDIIKANGKGNIEMGINEFGKFSMYGDYRIEGGDYLFTLKNVVNKKFRLEKGGTISWSGNPEQADINMNAIYELRTSLTPLFSSHEQTDIIKKRYPAECVMNLSGKLLTPDIGFDILLPTVDDFTRQRCYDKFKNSENNMNQQVFSLLFTNSFTSPPDIKLQSSSQETATGGPGAGTVTSTEMLSNQLSNWLSQISNEFDVGVHYRPGDEVNKNQVEVALSTQLFNDKMTIDGSVANNTSTAQNTANIVGDINVDYKLSDDGKFKAKAFNKANEGDILNTQKGPYTQGLGIFYREEFDTLGELYKRFLMKFKKGNKNRL